MLTTVTADWTQGAKMPCRLVHFVSMCRFRIVPPLLLLQTMHREPWHEDLSTFRLVCTKYHFMHLTGRLSLMIYWFCQRWFIWHRRHLHVSSPVHCSVIETVKIYFRWIARGHWVTWNGCWKIPSVHAFYTIGRAARGHIGLVVFKLWECAPDDIIMTTSPLTELGNFARNGSFLMHDE